MIDETRGSSPDPNTDRAGFCQDCGRALTTSTIRKVGSGTFCEPCLQARIASGTVPQPGPAAPPPPPPGGPVPPFGASDPSPALAALLGFIPGVGAMYNGQFAKGIAHLVIFLLLEAMTNAYHGFGILIMGWVFYQVFDAYYTARARREGTPLPDPFGLNNIGVQVSDHMRQDAARRAAQAQAAGAANPYAAGPNPYASGANPYAWTAPAAGQGPVQGAPMPPPPPYTPPPASAWTPVAAPAAAVPPDAVAPRRSNIPAAAAWLIGLGVIFTVLNVVPEWRFSVHKVFPFLLLAFAVWIFFRRMHFSGGISPMEGEGEAYMVRVINFLRAPVMWFSVGILWMLQEFDVIRLGRSWPILLIVLGSVMLMERSVTGRILSQAAVPPVEKGA